MGFENFEPNEEKGEENIEEKMNTLESPEEISVETEGDAPESEEKTGEELLEELWPSPEEKTEEKTSPSWGKAAIAAAALAGTFAAGTEAYAGGRDMFDELDNATEHVQKSSPEKKTTHHKAQEAFETIDEGESMAEKAIDHIRDTLLPNESNESERAKLQTIVDMTPNKVWSKVFVDKGMVQFGGLYSDPTSGKDTPFIFQYKLSGH